MGDAPDAVDHNRRALAETLGLDPPGRWWWLHQVHCAEVLTVAGPPAGPAPPADAAITAEAGRPLVVLTADCAPLVLACDDALAVVHVGWLGLLAGVIESAATRLRAVGHGAVRAALGPCIHPARYPFGAGDLRRLVDVYGPQVAATATDGQPALDLSAGVRAALDRADITDLHDVDVCTAASPDHFSYRRDGTTGRQGVVAVLDR